MHTPHRPNHTTRAVIAKGIQSLCSPSVLQHTVQSTLAAVHKEQEKKAEPRCYFTKLKSSPQGLPTQSHLTTHPPSTTESSRSVSFISHYHWCCEEQLPGRGITLKNVHEVLGSCNYFGSRRRKSDVIGVCGVLCGRGKGVFCPGNVKCVAHWGGKFWRFVLCKHIAAFRGYSVIWLNAPSPTATKYSSKVPRDFKCRKSGPDM